MEKILDNEYRKQRIENMEKLKNFGYIPYNESFERSGRLDKLQKEFEVGKELEVVIVEFGDLTSLSDDKQYGNFEIKVPEIDDDVMEEGAVLAYIERAATEERPQRWSQFPQYNPVWKEIGDTTFSYLSYGEGFVRISLQSETSVEGIAETFKGLKLKLVIFE